MIAIHIVHRRLANLTTKAIKIGGYDRLARDEQVELTHCLRVNAALVIKMDELKQLSFIAYEAGDTEWQNEICQKIDELEVKCL